MEAEIPRIDVRSVGRADRMPHSIDLYCEDFEGKEIVISVGDNFIEFIMEISKQANQTD